MKQVEQLLVPRRRVMIDYPDSPYEVGDILFCNLGTLWYDKYPAIFKRLEWYEERSEDEMPKYVSYISLSKKERFYGNVKTSDDNFQRARTFVEFKGIDMIKSWYGNTVLPATQAEYESFINQK